MCALPLLLHSTVFCKFQLLVVAFGRFPSSLCHSFTFIMALMRYEFYTFYGTIHSFVFIGRREQTREKIDATNEQKKSEHTYTNSITIYPRRTFTSHNIEKTKCFHLALALFPFGLSPELCSSSVEIYRCHMKFTLWQERTKKKKNQRRKNRTQCALYHCK